MSNQSPNTTMITARVPNADLFALKAQCDARRLRQTAAIVEAIRAWLDLEASPAPFENSAEIEALQARILELETQAAWFASKETGWETQSRAAAETIAKQAEEIADLKKQLARALRPPIPAKLALELRDGLTAPPPAVVGSLLKIKAEPKGRKP